MNKIDITKDLQTAAQAPEDPVSLFSAWLKEAREADPARYDAMCVATVGSDGKPRSRMLLLKGADENGLVFYTNKESEKGEDLAANPYASLCFFWKDLERQVRVRGPVTSVSDEEADAYFSSRPRGRRIGAWASEQSRPLESRAALESKIEEIEKKYKKQEDIPRPPYWSGYRLKPDYIEFWVQGLNRLHTRIAYTHPETGWERKMLNP